MNIVDDKDVDELEELSLCHCLYLKPLAKINITVQLPNLYSSHCQHVGQSISNWEVMEKLRALAKPIEFTQWKVIKSSLEFYRFQADVPSKADVKRVLSRLNGSHLKLSGFSDSLLVKASEAKLDFPRRYDWESFFRDATDMNEMIPGERPDTVHFQQLPIRWFSEHNDQSQDPANPGSSSTLRPNPKILKSVFQTFGEISEVEIPMLSPVYSAGPPTSTNATGHVVLGDLGLQITFEAYIQYKDFLSFVRCMDTLRGKALAHIQPVCLSVGSTAAAVTSTTTGVDRLKKVMRTAEIKVDFDRTKYLSRASIERRRLNEQRFLTQLEKQKLKEEEDKRLLEQQKVDEEKNKQLLEQQKLEEEKNRQLLEEQRLEEEKKRQLLEQQKLEEEKNKQLLEQQKLKEEKQKEDEKKEREARRLAREEARRIKAEERRLKEKDEEMQCQMLLDERKILVANRKLHACRLLAVLLQRVKAHEERRLVEKWEQELAEASARLAQEEERLQAEKALKAAEKEERKRKRLLEKEEELRNKILKKMKETDVRQDEQQRRRLKHIHSNT